MRSRVARSAPPLPLVVFDGACAFCRRWVDRWQEHTAGRVHAAPFQDLPLRRLGLRTSRVRRALAFIDADGARSFGAEAVFRALLHARHAPVRWRARLGLLPGVLQASEWMYRRVARRRGVAARVDRLLFGRSTAIARQRDVAALALRGLGATFAVAFRSLEHQLPGLYGARGIAPAALTQQRQATLLPKRRDRLLHRPSLFWFTGAEEATLTRAARWGRWAGVALMLGWLPFPSLLVASAIYLSFTSVGGDFLSFQWDALLVEMGLHGLLVAPLGLTLSRTQEPSGLARLAHRLLLLRLIFGSGLAKLQSGDPAWRDGSALATHHETTPLPTPWGWTAHQAPRWVHRATTYATLALELGAPFLTFGPRRVRTLGFGLLNALQLGIAATGNYGFFNLASSVLSLWSLDDAVLDRTSTGRWTRPLPRPRSDWREALANVAALPFPFVLLSVHELLARFERSPRALRRLGRAAHPFLLGNSYALFSVMTGTRPELVFEGSDDGVSWRTYTFRYKVQDPSRRPRWIGLHMPRLDWQLWFAALGSQRQWFLDFAQRLLEGAPEVRALLAGDPFPDAPPRYLRVTRYRYRMTSAREREETGAWWRRVWMGPSLPPVSTGPLGLRRAPGIPSAPGDLTSAPTSSR